MLLDLFSSIWFGVILLTLLFIYCSIGSSGVPTQLWIFDPAAWEYGHVRQWRGIELTEFEWFHWWPFDVLIALICANIIVSTIRRIPFNIINLGVWLIHGGIIVLAIGSVYYFSTKVEGDAPVHRRQVVISVPGMDEPVTMAAVPGNRIAVGRGEDGYLLQISGIDPNWELLSGEDKGKRAYKVSVRVQSKTGEFIRELIANKPEYTQDLIRSNDPMQPFTRAVNVIGKPLVDEALKLTLEYAPQEYFYLMDSRALYLREVGQTEWVQRPIKNLPRYNDYIASRDDVFQDPNDKSLPIYPLRNVDVPPVDPNDPLPDVTFSVSRYLRYAFPDTRRRPAPDGPLDPTVNVRLHTTTGESESYQLMAFHAGANMALRGNLLFVWVDSAAALERLQRREEPAIRWTIPEADIDVVEPITQIASMNPNLEFKPIPGTDYSYRVEKFENNLRIENREVSVAIVRIRTPQRTFDRWVFDDPSLSRDMALAEGLAQHGAQLPLDERIVTQYMPGTHPPAPIMVIAGPGEDDLAVMVTTSTGQPRFTPVKQGDEVPIVAGVQMTIDRYAARTVAETKPFVVPRERRDRNVREHLSIIRLDVPTVGGSTVSRWLQYHNYVFDRPEEVLRRSVYRPEVIRLADGREIEVIFSRARMKLPAPVVLEEFQVDTHIGGFTGRESSIMDWKSLVRFQNEDGTWGELKTVRVNNPVEHNGYWFYQAMWDPPDRGQRFEGDPGSNGLNYTVLGVGNRNGVNIQLWGCCIAVFGMIYAFYVKPVIKRRRQQAVYSRVGAAAHSQPHSLGAEDQAVLANAPQQEAQS